MNYKILILALLLLFYSLVFGQIGEYLDFDGGNYGSQSDGETDYVAMGDYSTIIGETFTVECWFKADAITSSEYGNTILASSPTSGTQVKPLWVALRGNQIKVYTFVDNNDDFGLTGLEYAIEANKWYHLAISADRSSSGRTIVYLNGALIMDFATKGNTPWADTFTLGDLRPGRALGLDGAIGNVRLWNDVRTPGEIVANQLDVFTSGDNLVGAWYGGASTEYTNSVQGGINGILGISPADPEWKTGLPLPVTLSTFTAIYLTDGAQLQWTTQSESANMGWNIYRSTTGNAEEAAQLNVGLIAGAGTVSEPTDYMFTDADDLMTNQTYFYWVEDVTYGNVTELHGPVSVQVTGQGDTPDSPEIADQVMISNYPNPFNPSTSLYYSLKDNEVAESIEIYNVRGQKVRSFDAPANPQQWDGKDMSGTGVSSGIYMYVLKTSQNNYVKKMVLSK